jgi:ATP-dependent Lon protease
LLAALRAGIKRVIIPADNVKDLAEIPAEVTTKMEIIAAAHVDDVLKVALVRMPDPIAWDVDVATPVKPLEGAAEDGAATGRVTAH